MKTIFLRVLEADDKAVALRAAIREPGATVGRQRFEVEAESFSAVPRSPFAYWVSVRLRQLFKELPLFEVKGRTAKQGLATADDFRFVRGWWAVPPRYLGERWFPFAKGGKFAPFYADVFLSLDWRADGHEMKAWAGSLYNNSHWSRILKNIDFFFRPGLTWPRRTDGLSLRAMPAGCIFADKGPAAFVEKDSDDDLLALAAITNSGAFGLLVSLQLARTELAQSYEVGLIQRTPIPRLTSTDRSILAALARRAWSLKRSIDTCTENSHAFCEPALLRIAGDSLSTRADVWAECVRRTESEVTAIQGEIDARCFDLYGINETDRSAFTQEFGARTCGSGELADTNTQTNAEADDDEDGDFGSTTDAASLSAELISWTVGVAFGRFDVRVATGSRPQSVEPKPLDPLPRCSPGMLTGNDGLPLASAPVGYPCAFPENGILVDDPGDARDLTAAVRVVFDKLFDG